jgi:predicted dienelactone hydrolase
VLEDLISAAPEGCPSPVVEAAVEGAPLPQQAPVLVMSHCHDCLGLSGATVAATLARHGYIVVAPDHVGNTLFDLLDENGGSLDEPTLAQRARDSSAALSAVLDGTALPAGLSADPDQVGALGHSFGAVTVGRLIRDDPRVQAGFTLGAPLDNPLLVGVNAGDVTVPVLQLVLEEDHSIGTLGNDLMRSNHLELQGEAWLVSMPDAGHWSVSDLCGVIDAFKPGCGDDTRMQGGATFSYIAADAARRTAGMVGAAFFDHALRGDAQATAWLDEPETEAPVTSEAR